MKKPFTVVKFSDEGTSSPFPARLMLQMCQLRDSLLAPEDKKLFDEAYNPVIENFMEIKQVITELRQLEERHNDDLAKGLAAEFNSNGQITITRPIQVQYGALIKEFFIKGQIIVSAISRVGKVFGLRSSFFFADDRKYQKGAKKLKEVSKNACFVTNHLDWARSGWYGEFNRIRNRIVHDSFKFPHINYNLDGDSKVVANYPLFSDNDDNCTLLQQFCERILELVECCIVFFFTTKLKESQLIKDIPEEQRDPANVIRYRLFMQIGDQFVPFGNQ